jgi:hypothetical protein
LRKNPKVLLAGFQRKKEFKVSLPGCVRKTLESVRKKGMSLFKKRISFLVPEER